jgi:hypothetical protein
VPRLIQCQPLDKALTATLAGGNQIALVVLLNEANRLNAGHDRLAQITAEPVPATLLTATVPGMPLLEAMRTRLSGQRRWQNLRNRQTWRRTAAISSIAAKLESATVMMSRPGSQRLIWRMPWRAQSTNDLWRLPLVSSWRCDGANRVRNGKAQRRCAKGSGIMAMKESQRRPLALTKWPCEERTGSR